jgi:hypothetical protein
MHTAIELQFTIFEINVSLALYFFQNDYITAF